MKFIRYSKRILSLLLICSMLALACSCAANKNSETDSDQFSDSKESDTQNSSLQDTDNPLLDTDILISGEKPFRIVYSEGYRSQAIKIQNKLIAFDKNYTTGKYSLIQDTTAADGTPEILVGDTNRPETAEAKSLITQDGHFYAIYATKTAIAVYSAEEAGVQEGVQDLISKLAKNNNSVIYSNAKGNYAKQFEVVVTVEGNSLLEALTNTAKNKDLPVYTISVSSENGISTSTINSGNPCQNCYSVTKVYCVTAIGMLYDEGKLNVNDTIGNIFADEIAAYGISPTKWENITIHDVLRHRAGFTQGGLLDIDAQDATKWGSQDYLKLVLEANLNTDKNHKYTDAAYYLISRVVSKVSGENLDIFLAKRLFNKTDCREFAFATCPQGYPIGATGLYIRSADVAKLGRIYLDGGKYNGKQIISQKWIDLVIQNGYELNKSGTGYAKGGMRGQYLYINFTKNVAVAWHSYDPKGKTGAVGDTLHSYLAK